MPVEMNPSSGWLDGPFECPRQQFIVPALPVTIHDGGECAGQVGRGLIMAESKTNTRQLGHGEKGHLIVEPRRCR